MKTDYLKMLIGPGGCLSAALAEGEQVVCQVDGECMEPAVGHQASVRLDRLFFFIPGDVVAFYCPNFNRLLIHRFLGYLRWRGAWKLMTMPDKGVKPDPLVDISAVLGRVVALDSRTYRISPIVRLKAIYRYALWCLRYLFRRLLP